jgi:hypothetical protein
MTVIPFPPPLLLVLAGWAIKPTADALNLVQQAASLVLLLLRARQRARVGCPRTFPRSKHLNLSYERAFGAYSANQKIDVATQHNICEANQDTAEHSTTSVQPIRSEKIIQWRRDRPRSDALVLRAAPASIVDYRLKNY